MIVFLTLCYVAVLAILVKLRIIRLNLWWKISPLIWILVLLVALFIPRQWGAPTGRVQVYQYVVEVTPEVSGKVFNAWVLNGEPITRGGQIAPSGNVPQAPNAHAIRYFTSKAW
jgi:multidrug resistance efflux pump